VKSRHNTTFWCFIERPRDHTKQNNKILEKQMQSVFVVFEAQRQNEKKGEENIMGINNLGEGRSPYKVLGKVSKN
jgi:hypothetical protein